MYDTTRCKQSISAALVRLGALLFVTILPACGGSSSSMPAAAPSVTAQAPSTTVNRTVTLKATAMAASGASIMQVNFLVDGTQIGTATTATSGTYTYSWDTTTTMDGTHTLTVTATDSNHMTGTSAGVMVTVMNNLALNFGLAPNQLYPMPTNSTATGVAALKVDLATGALSGSVTVNGVTPTNATMNQGFAGSTGTSVVTLTQNATTPTEWDVPATTLTADQVSTLLQGQYYIVITSAANANGEIRGQILPTTVTVAWSSLSAANEAASTATGTGTAATTVDSVANTVTVYVNTTGLTATGAQVNNGTLATAGTTLVTLTQANANQWSVQLSPIQTSDVSNFTNSMWAVNVVTANGAIGSQIMPAPTLTQLAMTIFVPKCSSCHTGIGTVPPGALNLTGGPAAFKALVGVPTGEIPTLDFVTPGNPNGSYIIQKLEGAPGIIDAQMPLGGPYLDAATIAQVAAWIAAGPQDN